MELEKAIKDFEMEVNLNLWSPIDGYKINNNFIYLRLSALNNELKPEDRVKDAIDKLKADFNKLLETYPELKKEGYKLFVEVKSAYKNSERPVFINLYEKHLFEDLTIKDLLEDKGDFEEKNLYMASYDRLSRVFFYSLTFQLIRKLRGINIFTLNPDEQEFEKRNKDIKNEENLNQTMFVFQLMMISSIAGKHSEDMSHKIKKRVMKTSKGTFSSKSGKKWGVTKTIPEHVEKLIIERFKRFTGKEIIEMPDIYQIKDEKKEKISLNTLRKIIQNNNKKKKNGSS